MFEVYLPDYIRGTHNTRAGGKSQELKILLLPVAERGFTFLRLPK